MPKKRTKTKRPKNYRSEQLFKTQAESAQIAPQRANPSITPAIASLEMPEAVAPPFFQRLENSARRINQIVADHAAIVFIVCAVVFAGFVLIQANTYFFSNVISILVIPAIIAFGAAFICAVAFVVKVLFLYIDFQRDAEKRTGIRRFGMKIFSSTLIKSKTWVVIGAIFISTVLTGQFGFTAIYQIAKQYNPVALALFTIAQVLPISYFVFFFYGIVLQPFIIASDDLIKKCFGISLVLQIPFKGMLSLLIGGYMLYVILMLIASLIDPQILILFYNLAQQLSEAQKLWMPN